jgi:chromosome segregation ATPase
VQAKTKELEKRLQSEQEEAAKAKEACDKLRRERNEASAAEMAAKSAQDAAEAGIGRLEAELERNRQLQRQTSEEAKKSSEHLRSLFECVTSSSGTMWVSMHQSFSELML